MMKNKKLYALLTSALLFGGCSSENPFVDPTVSDGVGEFSKVALDLDIRIDDIIRQSMATKATNSEINLDDFTIYFQDASSGTVKEFFRYGDMPEVVTLEAGTYKIVAIYGENSTAAWNNPHLKNREEETQEFTISRNNITTDIGTIKCYLENIMVSVIFDGALAQRMSDDSVVEVSVSNSASLKYTKDHGNADSPIPGYFAHNAESTLTATFKGAIDGSYVEESTTLSNVNKGNHYRITFSRYDYNGEDSGNLNGNINVNASVTTTNVEENVTVPEDEVLNDNERPKEDDPNVPIPEEPIEGAPIIEVVPNPNTGSPDIDLSQENIVTEDSYVALKITSNAEDGIQKFDVHIDMYDVDLDEVGLTSDLDLIEPGVYLKKLQDLGLMDDANGGKLETLRGVKEHTFNVASLMPLLCIKPGKHTFKVTVGDSIGETTKTMILIVNE